MPAKLNKTISLRLNDDTFAYFNTLAEKDRRRVAEYIRLVLEDVKAKAETLPVK